MVQAEYLHEQDLKKVQQFRLFDDDFLKEVFDRNYEATELLLNIIFDRTDLKVTKVLGQREIKGIEGHSVRLDIMAEDSEHHVYNVEVQRQDKGWLPQRARYNSSMMDTVLLPAGEDYSKLVPTYVIFFTETDTIGDGLPLHHYMMQDVDTGRLPGDERHILFVNGDYDNEETQLGKLVHDFKCTSADDMYFDTLANRVRHFKETEVGISHMCKIMEDMRKETAIMTYIYVSRKHNMKNEEVIAELMSEYNITETEAEAYMAQSDKMIA